MERQEKEGEEGEDYERACVLNCAKITGSKSESGTGSVGVLLYTWA